MSRLNVKVKKDLQVSIPKALAKKYKIKQGDLLSVSAAKDGILFKVKPKEIKMTNDEIREYWRKRIQEEGEVELDERTWKKVEAAIKASERGEIIGPFDNIKDAIKFLRLSKT